MRNIDSSILTKLAQNEIRPFNLLQLVIDERDYRYTDCDVPIALPDDKIVAVEDLALSVGTALEETSVPDPAPRVYSPVAGFKYTPIKYSMSQIVDKATIQLSVVKLPDMILAFAGGTPQGGLAIIRKTYIDDDYSVVGGTSAMAFEGSIDGWTLSETTLKINLVNQFVQWSQKALRLHGPSCTWRVFKGLTSDSPCMYTGEETWCDRTYARCEVLANTDNFGGFRWLPSIVDKEIWWGREKQ